jgi:hypothetical protein
MKALRITLGILLGVIALNAIGGGYYGLAGAENVPTEWLKGSPFESYFIPSLFLFLIVGGMCTISSIAMFRNAKNAPELSIVCACLLLLWIGAQVYIIGYVSWMQPAIFISGLVIMAIAFVLKKQTSSHA